MSAAPAPAAEPKTVAIFDAARACAALAVLLAHARSFILLDATEQPALSEVGRAFYGVSGLGHQAVIVFFVVSGALVTGSLLRLQSSGRWSGRAFATARLTRLWVVLGPCLLLGGLLDRLGESLGDPLVYAGHYGALRPHAAPLPVRLDATVLLGNLAFLQTIVVPPFGTNVPLWSLANEAWYYVLAFLGFGLWRDRGNPGRCLAFGLVLIAVAAVVMTPTLWVLAPAWAIGAAVALGCPASVSTSRSARWGSLALFGAVLAACRVTATTHQLVGDYALAIAFAGLVLTHRNWAGSGAAGGNLRAVARLSYSLYLSHFPLLALVAAIGLRNRRMPFGATGLLWLVGGLAVALAWAVLIWWLFERHTDTVRRWVEAELARLAATRRWAGREGAQP